MARASVAASTQYYILGACQSIDDSGMASKELRQLELGDTIDIIWQVTDSEGEIITSVFAD